MKTKIPKTSLHLWSASPTPLTPNFEIDEASLERAVEWHHQMGVDGLFMAGTCGEGPFLRDEQTDFLTRRTVALSAGRMAVSVQVTDNSAGRVLDRIARARDCGADMVTVAPPHFDRMATPFSLRRLYVEVIEQSPLPVCIYQIPGKGLLPLKDIEEVYAHPNLRMIKDSTNDKERQNAIFAVAEKRTDLVVLTGIELGYYDDFIRGFRGGLLGGAILNAAWVRGLHAAVLEGNHDLARAISRHMEEFLYEIFGGKQLTNWLGGLKLCLQRMGVLAHTTSHFDMNPDPETVAAIERLVAGRFWEFDLGKLQTTA